MSEYPRFDPSLRPKKTMCNEFFTGVWTLIPNPRPRTLNPGQVALRGLSALDSDEAWEALEPSASLSFCRIGPTLVFILLRAWGFRGL